MSMTPKYSPEEIERRLAALKAARWNNAMEGLYENEDDAVLLDAFARGEIDRAAFEHRVRENLNAALARRGKE